MAVDFSLLALISNAILPVVTFIVWLKIHSAVHSLNLPPAKKTKTSARAFLVLFGWLGLSLFLASLDAYHVSSEIISAGVPLGFILPILIGWHYMNKSATLQNIIDRIPGQWIIFLQTYRIIGIVFLLLLAQNLLPALFAIPTGFGDVLIGITAPIVGFFYIKKKPWSRMLARIWNYIGILDLGVAIGLGILLVLPPPFSLISTSPTTEIMTLYPMVLVPVYAVPLSILMHLASLRKLGKEK
ncbi:MAG: hypothetical protein HY393_03600 [Candidatus Diapherotrites archaeon]|nr:hypothetical protein [Candidatus Diapherotrites archaeon]